MARRTYLVEMNALAYRNYRYLTRYRDRYYPTLSGEQKIAVDSLIGELQSFLLIVPKEPIVPDSAP